MSLVRWLPGCPPRPCPGAAPEAQRPSSAPLPTLTQHALPQPAQLHVGVLEGILHLLVQRDLLALHQDGGAPVQDALRGPLHHQHVALGTVFSLVDGQLERRQAVTRGPAEEASPDALTPHPSTTVDRGRACVCEGECGPRSPSPIT